MDTTVALILQRKVRFAASRGLAQSHRADTGPRCDATLHSWAWALLFRAKNFFTLFSSLLFLSGGSVQFTRSVVSDSMQPDGLQHTRPPCPSPTPRVYSNSCPSSLWCHPTISSSVVSFSSCLQSFPASGSFHWVSSSQSGGQSIGASTSESVLPMNIQDLFPFGGTGWISLQSKGLSRLPIPDIKELVESCVLQILTTK